MRRTNLKQVLTEPISSTLNFLTITSNEPNNVRVWFYIFEGCQRDSRSSDICKKKNKNHKNYKTNQNKILQEKLFNSDIWPAVVSSLNLHLEAFTIAIGEFRKPSPNRPDSRDLEFEIWVFVFQKWRGEREISSPWGKIVSTLSQPQRQERRGEERARISRGLIEEKEGRDWYKEWNPTTRSLSLSPLKLYQALIWNFNELQKYSNLIYF